MLNMDFHLHMLHRFCDSKVIRLVEKMTYRLFPILLIIIFYICAIYILKPFNVQL